MIRNQVPRSMLTLALMFLVVSGCGNDSDKAVTPNPMRFANALPIGVVNAAYFEHLDILGGSQPYTYNITPTDLPPGVAFQGGPARITFSGMPTTAGMYVFTVQVVDALKLSHSEVVTVVITEAIDLSGVWTYDTVVTRATGACLGEEGDEGTAAVTVIQTGNQVTLSGLLGVPTNIVSGTLNSNELILSGSYPEEGGTTTGTHRLTVYSLSLMTGIEDWTWTDGVGGTCPGSTADIRGTR